MTDPVCGHPMRRYEFVSGEPALEDQVCGRKPGHKIRHRSAAAMERARRRGATCQAPSGSPFVAAAIRQARERSGMSQRRLAAVAGVSVIAVQKWEYAERSPSAGSWVQLELALGPLGIVREHGSKIAPREKRNAA